MKRKISFGVLILAILIFAWNKDAYSDFGSFSGTTDYSTSHSSSNSDHKPTRTSTTRTHSTSRPKTSSINLNSGTNHFNAAPLAAGTLGGSNDDDVGGVTLVIVIAVIFFISIKFK